MKKFLPHTPAISDLEAHIATGKALGAKFRRRKDRTHAYLYRGLQFCGETYVRLLHDDGLKDEFFEICRENGIKHTAASQPLAMLVKLVLGLDDKAASAASIAILFALGNKIYPRKLAAFFRKHPGGVQGCVSAARKAARVFRTRSIGSSSAATLPKTIWTRRAREELRSRKGVAHLVMLVTLRDNGILEIARVLERDKASRKLRHLADKHSAMRAAASQ